MESIQIDGIYTYVNNIKKLTIGQEIKLMLNPHNRINSDAIGAYTLAGEKIGYVPFKSNQIDIKAKYTVTKINLTLNNPVLLISRQFEQCNFIQSIPPFINLKNRKKNNESLNEELKSFATNLIKTGNEVTDIKIIYNDDNFIDLQINTPEENIIFNTVTRKYYEENIFKYDEFYKFKISPKCIYQPFLIHRLDSYLKKYYKPIDKLLKMKKFNFNTLIKANIFESLDIVNNINCGFEKIEINNLKSIESSDITGIVYNQQQLDNLIQLIVQYNINSNEYYNPEKYLQSIHNNKIKYTINPNLVGFIQMYNHVKVGGICYNHSLKYYCFINLYDDYNIIDISTNKIVTKEKFIELLIKLVISNKQMINIYNPIDGIIYRINISELIKNKILNIISK